MNNNNNNITQDEELKGMNAQEERELRRVFDHLAFFRQKKRIELTIQEKKERRLQLEKHNKHPDSVAIIDSEGNRMTDQEINEEYKLIGVGIEKKLQELNSLNNTSIKYIQAEDLNDALTALGKTCSRKQISDMIWEADENLDNVVDWEELRALFTRNLLDKSGLEPVNLFNVIQFMTYDKKLCGNITADDTMAILFARYGRVQLESRMRNLFGDSDELSFSDYLERVGRKRKKKQHHKTEEKK